MLSFLLAIAYFIYDGVSKFKDGYDYGKSSINKLDKDGLTFIDNHGKVRLKNTGEIVTRCLDPESRDELLWSCEQQKVLINFSELKRIEEMNMAKKKGWPTVIVLSRSLKGNAQVNKNGCLGILLKDVDTGKLLVGRHIKKMNFYMDANTGYLIRLSDGQVIKNGSNLELKRRAEIIISEFNKKHDNEKIEDGAWIFFHNLDSYGFRE